MPNQTEAEQALARARALKQAMRGARGAELRRLRSTAIESFRRVAERYPESGKVCAEAHFRAGELLRSQGDFDLALVALERASLTPAGAEFVGRARYEAAHILRRQGELDAALALFAEVRVSPDAGQRRRNLASLWHAKVNIENGAHAVAEDELRKLVKQITDPYERLRCYDELILLVASNQRIEAAVGYFAEAKLSVLNVAAEQTERGERVRRALENMRALGVLQTLIEARFHGR